MISNPTNIMRIDLPENWSEYSFKKICEFDKKTVDPLKNPDQIYNYITISDIQDYGINSYKKIIGKEAPSRARKKVIAGDIIVSTVRPYLRAFAKIDERYDNFICSTGFSVITPKEKVLSDYIYFLIQTDQFANELMRRMVGATYPAVTSSDIKHLKIPIPPLVEQRGIVEVLGTVDECIRLTDAVIERAEELKRGLMQQLLTRGIGHTEFKETPLGKIPKTWDIKRIGDFITLQRGYDLPIQDRVDGSYPVIGSNGIVGHHNEFKVQGPGVIVGRSGTLGRVYYYEDDYWPLNTSLYVKKFRDCDRKFAYYFLQHINLNRFSTGTSVPTLNRNYVHPYKVVFPPFEEQRKIVEILDAQTVKIEKEQEKKEHLNKIKQGLMQLLLSGKIRVELKGDELHRIRDGREANN